MTFEAILKIITAYVKTDITTFWPLLVAIGPLFSLTSGHTRLINRGVTVQPRSQLWPCYNYIR